MTDTDEEGGAIKRSAAAAKSAALKNGSEEASLETMGRISRRSQSKPVSPLGDDSSAVDLPEADNKANSLLGERPPDPMALSSFNPARLPDSVNTAGSKNGLTILARIGRNWRAGSGRKVPTPVKPRLADAIWPALDSSGKGASIGSRRKESASARIMADEQTPTTAA